MRSGKVVDDDPEVRTPAPATMSVRLPASLSLLLSLGLVLLTGCAGSGDHPSAAAVIVESVEPRLGEVVNTTDISGAASTLGSRLGSALAEVEGFESELEEVTSERRIVRIRFPDGRALTIVSKMTDEGTEVLEEYKATE